jgi:ribosomal protein L40E
MSMPLVFGLSMGLAAVLGIFAMWQSLRATFQAGHIRDLPSLDTGEAHRALEDEKQALLGNIRDLRFEHEAGKIAADDFERQDARLRARAREVLRLLDEDIDAYVRRAEKLITESLGPDARSPYRDAAEASPEAKAKAKDAAEPQCPGCKVANDPDAEFCKKCGKGLKPHICSGCETVNDLDAEFCKKCGQKLLAAADEPSAADESEEAADESEEAEDDAESPEEEDTESSEAEDEPSAADGSEEAEEEDTESSEAEDEPDTADKTEEEPS